MARLSNRALFFTTSPRTPAKMLPEIRLLHELFEGRKWDNAAQEEYYERLSASDFFEGSHSRGNMAFSARDRINRAPKALGFVELAPAVSLTEAGYEFAYGKRPQEVFLRQLLKFQLPSPYHVETAKIAGSFFVRPFLEIMRLVRELEYITFAELKIIGLRLVDYRKFGETAEAVMKFRDEARSGRYRQYSGNAWTDSVKAIYSDDIIEGRTRTRETDDASLDRFVMTKKRNMHDYADACFRYLRFTGLVSIAHRSREISISREKLPEVDFLLGTVERRPVFIDNEPKFKEHLFSACSPALYADNRDNIMEELARIAPHAKREFSAKSVDELKNLRDGIAERSKAEAVAEETRKIKSFALYSEIMGMYDEILSGRLYDAPLMLEYNTWRAMTMLDGGEVKGNFKLDDMGQPLSTAPGNVPDIECDYGEFALSVELTMQRGQRQYETEGESVSRHYGQLKKRIGKDAYCLFIAPAINDASLSHFFGLSKINIGYYGGKAQIIPLELCQFMKLLEAAHRGPTRPGPQDVKKLLRGIMDCAEACADEREWLAMIHNCVAGWPGARSRASSASQRVRS